MKQSISYSSGYKTGINWTGAYFPGGPFVFSCISNCDEICDSCKASREAHDEWRVGYNDGLAKRDEGNKK